MLAVPSATSATGLPVVDRYEIDTNLFASWGDLSLCFQKWRIRELRFNFVSAIGTSIPGLVYMCVLPDPDAAAPTTPEVIMSNQHAVMGPHYSNPKLRFRPRNNMTWLYTQDNVTSVDRFEMPGDFFFATSAWTSAQSPGRVYVDYVVEFTEVTNTLAGMTKVGKLVKGDSVIEQSRGNSYSPSRGFHTVIGETPKFGYLPSEGASGPEATPRENRIDLMELSAKVELLTQAISKLNTAP